MQHSQPDLHHPLSVNIVVASPFQADADAVGVNTKADGLRTLYATSLRQVLSIVHSVGAGAVICDETFPWRDLLSYLADHGDPPRMLLIVADAGSRICAEFLNLGGFDVLARPLAGKEVQWSVRSATQGLGACRWGNSRPVRHAIGTSPRT